MAAVRRGDSCTRNRWGDSGQRCWTEYSGGGKISEGYGPDPEPDITGTELLKAELKDSQRAKDLDWHLLNPGITLLTAGVPVTIGAFGLVFGAQFSVWATNYFVQTLYWPGSFSFIWAPVDIIDLEGPTLALIVSSLMGAPLLARLTQKVQAGWTRFTLAAPGRETELEKRVETLTHTRKTALELQTAEVQRIERDLHDGAQAHLVTVELTDGPHHLTAMVTDNGIGGAEHQEQPGGGIHGIRRRLEPFDGTLEILSPIGGGTTITIEVSHPGT